jgi:superfamily II DNA/RNA helicase
MTKVEDLARLSFKRRPLYVGVDDSRAEATREGLSQGYCVVPPDKRFLLLFTFLKKNPNKKVWGTWPLQTCGAIALSCSAAQQCTKVRRNCP